MNARDPHPRIQPGAAVAAWLLPGLGHILIGQKQRGLILMAVIGSLWLGGLLIGGITVIDHRHRDTDQYSWWFVGQALMAPSVAVDTIHNALQRTHPDPQPPGPGDPRPLYEPAFGHPAEQGTLYTALAGLLNLLCIFDVIYCDPEARRRQDGTNGRAPEYVELIPVDTPEPAPTAPTDGDAA